MKEYEIIETTADVGIAARGRDLSVVFTRAAAGMMSLITDPDRVEARQVRTVRVEAHDLAGLLAAWLGELLYLFETEDFIVKDCTVAVENGHGGGDVGLEAQVRGERVDPRRHVFKTAIKAVTYHQLELKKLAGLWQARVIFDI